MTTLEVKLYEKIERLNRKVWDNRALASQVRLWLENFTGGVHPLQVERLHMLFLLSNFMYFGSQQIRELLRAVFRDLYKYPIVESIRKTNNNTTDIGFIDKEFRTQLRQTRFLGMGNPSESGCHLLYYFRQMNSLPKDLFIYSHQIFCRSNTRRRVHLAFPAVRRYVFIDDFCGSGQQALEYSTSIVEQAKMLDSTIHFSYSALFGCKSGIEEVRRQTAFNSISCLVELDQTFACFSSGSRYFHAAPTAIDKAVAEQICRYYGSNLLPIAPLGFADCQLLVGFHHNTPDNTLPVFWWDEANPQWNPIFKRYPKLSYSWNP